MKRTGYFAAFVAALLAAATWLAAPSAHGQTGGQRAIVEANPAPSPEQLRFLIARLIENQHRNDKALEEFERIERVITRKADGTPGVLTDHTDRIVFCGSGNLKLQLAENGVNVSPELYRSELQIAVTALNTVLHPNDRYRADVVKFERRTKERSELVDSAPKAFRLKWAGRETRPDSSAPGGSRTLDKLFLDPDPDYKPTSRFGAAFEHVHATLWMDEPQAQIARIEGDVTSDITFIGGIAGKIYRGGHFVMEQTEVAPGVWLPTLYTYDVDGRKFLFGFGVHERTEITKYRHLGPPAQSLEIIRAELNNISAQTSSH